MESTALRKPQRSGYWLKTTLLVLFLLLSILAYVFAIVSILAERGMGQDYKSLLITGTSVGLLILVGSIERVVKIMIRIFARSGEE